MERLIYTSSKQVQCFYRYGWEMRTATGLLYARPSIWRKTPRFRIVWFIQYTEKIENNNDIETNQKLHFAKKDIKIDLLQKKDLFLRRLFRLRKLKRI